MNASFFSPILLWHFDTIGQKFPIGTMITLGKPADGTENRDIADSSLVQHARFSLDGWPNTSRKRGSGA